MKMCWGGVIGTLFFMYDLRFSRRWPWRIPSSGMLSRVALVRTDVSEELGASIFRVTRIGELGTMLAAATFLVHGLLSPWWWRRYVPPKRLFLQEPHGVTSQKTPFFTFLHFGKTHRRISVSRPSRSIPGESLRIKHLARPRAGPNTM
jgi:hypothetical protein